MYQVVVERAAEKDLKRLSSEVRARAATAILALAKNPLPAGSRKLAGTENDGASVSAITGSFMRSPMRSALCASTACGTGASFTDESRPQTMTAEMRKTLARLPYAEKLRRVAELIEFSRKMKALPKPARSGSPSWR